MKLVLASLVVFLLSVSAVQAGGTCAEVGKLQSWMHPAAKVLFAGAKQAGRDMQSSSKSGCCSWHGGVCGCRAGRVICCDGEESPSCTCHGPTPSEPGPAALRG